MIINIPIVITMKADFSEWAKEIGYEVRGDRVVSSKLSFSLEDFEECIREYIRSCIYSGEADLDWINERFFSRNQGHDDEKAYFKELLEENYEPINDQNMV